MKVMMLGQMVGGLDVYIRNTISYADDNIDYLIVKGEADNNKPVIHSGKEVREISISLYRALNPWKDIRGVFQAIKIIRNEKPNLVHCHSAKGGVVGRISAWWCGVPCAYTPHAFSFLCSDNWLKRGIFRAIEKITKFNTYVLACGESERKMAINEVGYRSKRALCWSNSVPDASKEVMTELNEKSRESLQMMENVTNFVAYIGRPSYQKNTLLWLEVIKMVHSVHTEVKFVLFGCGFYAPELDELKAKISEYGLQESVLLLPWLQHDLTMQKMKESLFYMTPARYEGLPLTVLEAMSMGKAIVASDVPGNRDCVKDGVNGRLVALTVEELAKATIELIEKPELREKYGKAAREMFERDFLIDNRIGALMEMYRKIAKN